MTALIFHTFLSVLGHILSLSTGTDLGDINPSNFQFSRRLDAVILRRLVGVSVQVCAKECGLRASCSGINYQRMMKMCEVMENNDGTVIPEQNKGWVYFEMTDKLKQVIMDTYCGGRANCRTGQKCSLNIATYQCNIEECPTPHYAPGTYLPSEGLSHLVGAKILVERSLSDFPYSAHCCADGTWAQTCAGSTTTPSLTPMSSSSYTTTSFPTVVINEADWYTLPSETRIRQLASIRGFNLSWKSAMSVCEQNGGSLAHIYDETERKLVHDWLASSPMEAQLWLGGMQNTTENIWAWQRVSGSVQSVEPTLWGTDKPIADENRKCTCLYRDNRLGNEYYLMNEFCHVQMTFICEKDFTDVNIDDIDWFLVNSSQTKREAAYIRNPTLSRTKAQEVCVRNGGTLSHMYYVSELSKNLRDKNVPFDEKLWSGAGYDDSQGEWFWLNNISERVLILDDTLWHSGSPSTAFSDCIWLSQQSWDEYYLGNSSCTEENSFLCQRELRVQIPEVDWFLLDDDVARLRSIAYVQTPTLNWKQSNDVCKMNGGMLVRIYTSRELELIINAITNKGIEPAAQIWTGGRYDTATTEWIWWSELDSGNDIVETSLLHSDAIDHRVGECVQLHQYITNFNLSPTNDFILLSSSVCAEQKAFLCQKEYAVMINEDDWFIVNGRKMAIVSQEMNWDTALAVCETNGGTLAYILDMLEMEQILRELEARHLSTVEPIWLGGKFDLKVLEWIWLGNYITIDSSLWVPGQTQTSSIPSEECIQMAYVGDMPYLQNDMCSNQYRFSCQKSI